MSNLVVITRGLFISNLITANMPFTELLNGWYFTQILRWMIPPMVVHPEKIDFRRFV